MSLNVYTSRIVVEELGLRVIDYNDIYFQGQPLRDDAFTHDALLAVDKAFYNSPYTFIGRDPSLGALGKDLLSTGVKTMLNIAYNPDLCFNVCECGSNALVLLAKLNAGSILWEIPVLHYCGTCSCDIQYDGLHFVDFKSFICHVMDN